MDVRTGEGSDPIEWAMLALIAFDVFGLISHKTPFDHAGHLGGALFGYFYNPIRVWMDPRR